jgi:hypothetical protein
MSLVFRIILIFFLCVQLTQTAIAGHVDFEGFADGDALTSEIPGLIFSDATVLTAGVSLNETDFPPHSGSNVIATFGGFLTVSFDSPVNLVSGFISYADAAGVNLSLYDINNILLADALFASPLSQDGIVSNLFISLGSSNVRSMVLSLNSAIPDSPFTFDDFSYLSIPEPATILLISLGVLGINYSTIKTRKPS